MPIYTLKCEKCKNEEEIICSYTEIKEKEKEKCPKCGKKKRKLKLNKPNLIGVN